MAVSLHCAHDEKLYCAEVGGRKYVKYVNGIPMAVGPIDKQRLSTRIKSIAVEAFGRHLKRVDASALFFVWM